MSYNIGYDSDGNTVEKTSVGNAVKTIIRGTDDNGSFVDNDGVRVNSESDDFGRTTKTTTSNSNSNIQLQAEYTYLGGTDTNSTTNLVQSLTQKLGNNQLIKYTYDYDDNNNIIQAYEFDGDNTPNKIVDYEYDGYDQFQREIDYINNTYTYYHYDDAGNITGVDKYQFDPQTNLPTTLLSQNTYEYGDSVWKDKLTKFNGTAITYDNSGNPLTYRDGMSFSWIRGRVLDKITINNYDIQMRYDSNGIRTYKGNVRYYYDSNNNLIALAKGSTTLFFYYDNSGNPTSFSDGTNMYYYVKNIQGDIVKIVSSTGAVVANYAYNVWGELLSVKDSFGNPITNQTSIAYLNPLRYRGYVYDDETGLYYLQSRYYDPITCRFINADIYCDTQTYTPFSTNMFAYCENNSISYFDNFGQVVKRISDSLDSTQYNCYAYAFGVKGRWLTPGFRKNTSNIRHFDIADFFEAVFDDFGPNVRGVRGWQAPLKKGEYLIAFRVYTVVTYRPFCGRYIPFYDNYDYHFWKQNPEDGVWWDKHGSADVERIGNVYPGRTKCKGWIMVPKGVETKFSKQDVTLYSPAVNIYYNSETYYFAYKAEFWI